VTFQKLRTLTISTGDLSPGMIKALRPPLGRLQYFRVAGHFEAGYSDCLNDVLGALLGGQGEGTLRWRSSTRVMTASHVKFLV